jgi:deoxyribodipyrimidine photo-lyase
MREMIQPERIHGTPDQAGMYPGDHVLYWMHDAVRTEENHALEYAIGAANRLNKPLLVHFCLDPSFPESNTRHCRFLADGLCDVRDLLKARGIRLQVSLGNPSGIIPSRAEDASLLVTDCGHLRYSRQWKEQVFALVSCPKVAIETGVVVPVKVASPKLEWSARTFRIKMNRVLSRFLAPLEPQTLRYPSLGWDAGGLSFHGPDDLVRQLAPDSSVSPVSFRGGQVAAEAQLSWFISERLFRYGTDRNDPTARATSRLGPYLHFGQISPVSVVLALLAAKSPGTNDFFEQMVIRRELSHNFVWYNPGYDRFESAVPDWAQRTLEKHRNDEREYLYSFDDLNRGRTHDPFWNAMQTEMRLTGYLHGYLRMYWGKKILEWSETPQEAFSTALSLNNRYQLDGRDPNGYTGVAWCFGRHDRPWKERPVFGTIRYMNASGLKRKFRVEAYRERIEQMATAMAEDPKPAT